MNCLFVALLLTCLATAAWGCADETQPDPGAGQTVAQVEQPSTGDASSGGVSAGQSQQASSESKGDDDATVSRTNPGLLGTGFDAGRNEALFDAQPKDVVTWSVEPTISAGALNAQGALEDGADALLAVAPVNSQ